MATEGEDTVVELERGKVYSIDAIMGYYNRTQDTGSKTSNRSITMYALNSAGQRANIGMMNTASTIDKSGIGDEYVQYIDLTEKSAETS